MNWVTAAWEVGFGQIDLKCMYRGRVGGVYDKGCIEKSQLKVGQRGVFCVVKKGTVTGYLYFSNTIHKNT